MKYIYFFIILFFYNICFGQLFKDSALAKKFTLHAQSTIIPQYHFPFAAKYTGINSLEKKEGIKTSFTATVFAGMAIGKYGGLYFNPEAAGGEGLSEATGVAGFPNGETFRIGSPKIKLFIARLFYENSFRLKKGDEYIADDQNQLRGLYPSNRIVVRVGRFSLTDYFDDNSYNHDPRTDFLNWSLMSSGAWDYPANTRGYTNIIMGEYISPKWAIRTAMAQVPTTANGSVLDDKIGKAFGVIAELQRNIIIKKNNNITARAGIFYNMANMGNYSLATKQNFPDVTTTRTYSRNKYGFYLNGEWNHAHGGEFVRLSWNDGQNETWAFTEIDRSFHIGLSYYLAKWRRPKDKWGAALGVNGISKPHQDYLFKGGHGFIIGDGALNYGPEYITEIFYSFNISLLHCYISPDYQFVVNPAYNKDRGPVHIGGLRLHFEL